MINDIKFMYKKKKYKSNNNFKQLCKSKIK